jgi:hypothetical protein
MTDMPREHDPQAQAADSQRPPNAAEASEPLRDLRLIAELAASLAAHLEEGWPVRGQGEPAAGPPMNFTISELYRHLVHLKTHILRFHPPAGPVEMRPRLSSRASVLTPVRASAVARVQLICDQLVDQFELKDAFQLIDGHVKCVLTPTQNTAQTWQPTGGGPIPEIDPQDISALRFASAKLLATLPEKPSPLPRQECEAATTRVSTGDASEAAQESPAAHEPNAGAVREDATAGGLPAAPVRPNRFAPLPGDRYLIAFGGREETIPMLVGLQVAEYLLRQPGKKAHVMEINRALSAGEPKATVVEDAWCRSDETAGLAGYTADAHRLPDTSSEKDLKEIERVVAQIDERAAEARKAGNTDEAERLEDEAAKARKYVRAERSQAARKRRGQSDRAAAVEKVRVKLTNNVTNALEQLRMKYNLPDLVDHLEAQIERGTKWQYKSVPGVEWAFDPGPR